MKEATSGLAVMRSHFGTRRTIGILYPSATTISGYVCFVGLYVAFTVFQPYPDKRLKHFLFLWLFGAYTKRLY